MKKAIILSSGGVDSTTCVSLAVDRLGAENVVTASIFMVKSTKKRSLRHARSQRTTMYDTTNLIFLPFSSIRTAPSSRAPQKRSPTRATRSRSPRTGRARYRPMCLSATDSCSRRRHRSRRASLRRMKSIFTSARTQMMRQAMPMRTAASPS